MAENQELQHNFICLTLTLLSSLSFLMTTVVADAGDDDAVVMAVVVVDVEYSSSFVITFDLNPNI